ncbi:lipid-binding SYLF domain-containing protein [Aeoliella sp. ICT_H6.2]|uniref:Lipid-binding SYLF domain-containing protein n=1 Tax=Aeoliella straminimaris TaxID=2954799 RepID=A0A9X2F877_9BACT|nr:lipid-binding SYLF domain-containing protein [Aeoliella straminimaris]MCO6044150.1 lipid-binding SYLF domain-containing protein [Aeoliella straminimaris]
MRRIFRQNMASHARLLASLLALSFTATTAFGQAREDETVRQSIQVLNEVMAIPAQAIPQRMLADAQGVAIIPNVIKGGFVIGARHGRGTLVVKDDNGTWHAPVFVTLTGGSVGWQAGVQATDVILVFKTKQSIQGIFNDKFTLGVDAAAAAGPVGRQASAATDLQLKAEVYSYARSRGLFIGASLDGSMLKVDGMANAAYYRSPGPQQPVIIPPAAVELVQLVNSYSSTRVSPVAPGTTPNQANAFPPANAPAQAPVLAQQYSTPDSEVIRAQLSQTSPELFEQLDPQWRAFLALPVEVFSGQTAPPIEAVQRSLSHYQMVVTNPAYQALANLPAFQSTYGLLRHYEATLLQNEAPLNLPPPPAVQ